MPVYNVLIAGIGGQGVITLGTYLKKAALKANISVNGSERRGGAQREGNVSTVIRYHWTENEKKDERHGITSPLIPTGCAHLLIGLEPLEALRASQYLNRNSVVVLNLFPLPPISVRLGEAEYPSAENIVKMFQKVTKHIYAWNLTEIAERNFQNLHAVNGISLGIASRVGNLPLSEADLLDVLREEARPEVLEHYRLGFELANEK
jgi:indolepyruvate ferredoxin oxidoreductase beta subunit